MRTGIFLLCALAALAPAAARAAEKAACADIAALSDKVNAARDATESLVAHVNRAAAYNCRGDSFHALQDYSVALHIQPSNPFVLDARGATFFGVKDYSRAFDDLDAAIYFAPDIWNLYVERGLMYEVVGDIVKAREDFETALRKKPDFASARGYLSALPPRKPNNDYDAFACPESYDSDAERAAAIQKYLDWVGANHGDWTVSHVGQYRYELLASHHCKRTLDYIMQHKAPGP